MNRSAIVHASTGQKREDSGAGRLIVLSGPSGVGKSTLVRKLRDRFPDRLVLSVSATTRPPRPGERDGVDYTFLSPDAFDARRRRGEFLECCEVFGQGYWYGTIESDVRSSLEAGKWVVLDIDVEGARAVLARYPGALTLFVRPRSLDELEQRLRERGTESDRAITRRLEVAQRELADAVRYEYQVVNDTVEEAVDQISHILNTSGRVST